MQPRWKLVWLFYGIALGLVSLVAVGLWLVGLGQMGAGAQQAAQLIVAFLYMPAPLAAALIVERVAGEGTLIRFTFQRFLRKLPRLLLTVVCVMPVWFLLNIALVYLLGNVLQVWGVGTLASNAEQIAANLTALLGKAAVPADAVSSIPGPVPLIALGAVAGLLAGFSVNGLFAFGEEYGWRGWLMNELRPLGEFKANVLTGTLWGLWHAPIIFLGFNYGPYRLVGPLFMVLFCIPMSFLFWRGRDFTGSTLTPAIMHGALNGSAGFFLLLVGGANELVRVPVGVLGAVSFALVAAGFWWVTAGRLRNTVDPERTTPELAARANPAGGVTV